jgi:hypothetical protein
MRLVPTPKEAVIVRKQDTFAKRQREVAKRAKAEAKRARRQERKDAPPGFPVQPPPNVEQRIICDSQQ